MSAGAWVKLAARDGHELDAYRVEPSGAARGGVVIIQEIFGVNGHIRSICAEYAREGYVTLAPALFDRARPHVELGYTPEGTQEGRALRTGLGWEAPILDLEAAAATLRPLGRVATMGFCWGGSLSFLMACRSKIDCAISYYGGQIIQFVDERPKAPVLMHFGEKDALISAADRAAIAAANPAAEIHVYAAGHGFNCTERADFEPASAALARERTLVFLRRHIG
ncbi:Dienelactone hydrolase family protein [Minicystis rosea]|nr:Dienelactone hydrolase family protein [Minicystis rosea]